MTKEIIVNAGELETRVAILENGRLMELHVEREQKIVGNIYKARVTKVLKGMDAAFVDIGIERNAFLAVSDVVPQDADGNGHHGSRELPPINQLLHANQEILAQVVRAPLGTKGARIATRLSIPGRYLVLMLNSGSSIGVSRKIEDSKERQRLRSIASAMCPSQYSLIVRTEADGRTEEELQQDLTFLVDMARRIEEKAKQVKAPALVHGDLTLAARLLRDSFTSDVDRLVVDSPSAYENAIEMVEMIAPHLKGRIFLYDEDMPIFHAYNIEPEIERTLRRKVWLPSGGHLSIDQAEALTAIDVNTGRFIGSVELSETVLTTNLQAAEEVARQLRLRDLGGIIVIDFIDMDNPKHRQQVTKVFEAALKRDRAKVKIYNISALGLVEMTRKRTGESLAGLLTEPCPYCSGIGRVQNPLTMALRIERELAATAVLHPDTEAYLVTAHPRVIASMLGFEGEAHRDLELYVGHPVYLRSVDDFHPNSYQLERLTLVQALTAVAHLEEGDVIDANVVNPDPELSLSPLLQARGMYLIAPELDAPVGTCLKVRIRKIDSSVGVAEPLAEEFRRALPEASVIPEERPPLVPEKKLPPYLREERRSEPPAGMRLLSPVAYSGEEVETEVAEGTEKPSPAEYTRENRRKRGGRRGKRALESEAVTEAAPVEGVETLSEVPVVNETPVAETAEVARKSRRRRRRKHEAPAEVAITETVEGGEAMPAVVLEEEAVAAEKPADEAAAAVLIEEPAPAKRSRRSRRGGRRHRRSTETALPEGESAEPIVAEAAEAVETMETVEAEEAVAPVAEPVILPPLLEEITPEAAAEALSSMLEAIPEAAAEPVVEAAPQEEVPAPKPRRRRTRKTAEPAPDTTVETAPAAVSVEEQPALPLAPESAPAEVAAPVEASRAEEPEAPTTEKPKRKTPARRRTKKKESAEEPEPPIVLE